MRRSVGVRLRAEELEARDTPVLLGLTPGGPPPLAVSGLFDGTVKLYAPIISTGQFSTAPVTITPFPGFAGEVRTAFGDVNGDAIQDLVAVTGPGFPTRVVVLSGTDFTTQLVPAFDPFGDPGFAGGGFVAAGDIDRDGRAEFVVTPDVSGGPRVAVYSLLATGLALRSSFFGIDDPNFRGGARPAVGLINADIFPDVAVAAGPGGGPRVAVWSGSSLLAPTTTPVRAVSDFFAFPNPETLRDGVYIAAGDIDGDGFADLVIGAGTGGAPRVLVLSGRLLGGGNAAPALSAPLENFVAFGNFAGRAGVRVAAKPVGSGTRAEVAVGTGPGEFSRVRVYTAPTLPALGAEPAPFQDIDPFGQVMVDGVYVG